MLLRSAAISAFCCFTSVLLWGGQLPEGLDRANASETPLKQSPCAAPSGSGQVLGNVVQLLADATAMNASEFTAHPPTHLCKLPGGQIYFEVASMNVDDDGNSEGSPKNWEAHPVRKGQIDKSHQDQTSYLRTVSAFKEPYIVLPGVTSFWFRKQGIRIGDGVVVIKRNVKIVAVFADVGPNENLGEMSVKAHQLFGFDAFQKGYRARLGADGLPLRDPQTGKLLIDPAVVTANHAQDGPFLIIVFPHTSAKHFVSVNTSLQPEIDKQFGKLAEAP